MFEIKAINQKDQLRTRNIQSGLFNLSDKKSEGPEWEMHTIEKISKKIFTDFLTSDINPTTPRITGETKFDACSYGFRISQELREIK